MTLVSRLCSAAGALNPKNASRFPSSPFKRLRSVHLPPRMPTLELFRKHSTASQNDYWFRSLADAYKPGEKLTVANPSQDGTIEVRIVKAFHPFTNAVALLVEPLSSKQLPSSLILKLADRRLSECWNPDREREYQLNVQSHFAGAKPLDLVELPDWMIHLDHWEYCVDCHNREYEAYQRLTEAQHLGLVPRLFGRTYIEMMIDGGHPSLSRMEGLLIEYIEGRRMSSLRPGISISIEQAEVVSQHVLELGRRLRRYGVSHNDIHIGNVILRYPDDLPVLIDWGRASLQAADLPLNERWVHISMEQNYNTDIRYLLRLGYYFEGPEEKAVSPEITAGGVWHRYRTPLSNEEQYSRADKFGWDIVNGAIEQLSLEERDKFYDEDIAVEFDEGLRWRVKKGMKTRLSDDPVPER